MTCPNCGEGYCDCGETQCGGSKVSTDCGCSPTSGSCDEHRAQAAVVSAVSDAMSEADETKLADAVKYLGAVEVAPGRYAWEVGRQWVTDSAENLAAFGADRTDERGSALLNETPVFMPSWWSPERPYAVRDINSGKIVPDAVLRGSPLAYQGVTADLATGELIAANLSNVPRSKVHGAA